ncbi:unnamed protein product [Caenorhabditis nigoni]
MVVCKKATRIEFENQHKTNKYWMGGAAKARRQARKSEDGTPRMLPKALCILIASIIFGVINADVLSDPNYRIFRDISSIRQRVTDRPVKNVSTTELPTYYEQNYKISQRVKRQACAASCPPLTKATTPAYDGLIATENFYIEYSTDASGCPIADLTCVGGDMATLDYADGNGDIITLGDGGDDYNILEAQLKCFAFGWAAPTAAEAIDGNTLNCNGEL